MHNVGILIGWPIAKIWPFEIFQKAADRHLGFYPTGSSTIRSADLENPTLEFVAGL